LLPVAPCAKAHYFVAHVRSFVLLPRIVQRILNNTSV